MDNIKSNLPKGIQDRLGAQYGSQRVIDGGEEEYLIILHDVPKHNVKKRKHVLFLKKKSAWFTSESENKLSTMNALIERYKVKLDNLDNLYDSTDSCDGLLKLMEEVLPISRAAHNMFEAIQHARKLMGKDLIDLRDLSSDIARNYDLLYQDCKNKIDFIQIKKQEALEEITRKNLSATNKLNVLMATFLPLTAISSAFGMNFVSGHINNILVVAISVVSLGIGFSVKTWISKK
jgi:hypothetical protein